MPVGVVKLVFSKDILSIVEHHNKMKCDVVK
jgi:hypothetical protein